jgi:hypothetical protein
MARNFRELEAKMPTAARARSDAKARKMIAEMALAELRQAMGLTRAAGRGAAHQPGWRIQAGKPLGHFREHAAQGHRSDGW